MYRYILCFGICAIIWIINGRYIMQAKREHVSSEIYIHTGLALFLSLLTFELALGTFELWGQLNIRWLTIVGLLLQIPSGYLVASSIHALKYKGKPKITDFTATTTFIDSGIYSFVRQPMTLGMAIWSVALILVFQSILAVILGVVSLFCFWISARKESEYDIRKFGNAYKKYIQKVPMWNILKGLRKR
jgi:protein-S-isoprenylcysteine O-methyltransferase Ste14